MIYLLFDWNYVPEEVALDAVTDEQFIDLAERYGTIYTSEEAFESAFNKEFFSTATHQLKILKNNDYKNN